MKTIRASFCVSATVLVAAAHLVSAQDSASQPATGPAPTTASHSAPTSMASSQPTTSPFGTTSEKLSYGLGYSIGEDLRRMGISLKPELLVQGLNDSLSSQPAKLSPEEFHDAMTQTQQEMAARQQEEAAKQQAAMATAGVAAAKEGEEFLKTNKGKPGVKVLPDGLQYEILKEGTGPNPKATDIVEVNYIGTLVNGTRFDSNTDPNKPAKFPLNGVIKGWTEGLPLIKVGGKIRLVIPPDLGYGPQGSPPVIPPNSTLIFEVDVLSAAAPAEAPAPAK